MKKYVWFFMFAMWLGLSGCWSGGTIYEDGDAYVPPTDGDNENVDGDDEGTDGDTEITDGDNDNTDVDDPVVTTGYITGRALINETVNNSGIDVQLLLADVVIDQTQTDSYGNYEFLNVEPNTYTIFASWSSSDTYYFASTEVKVNQGDTVMVDDLTLVPTGNIEGTASLEGAATGNEGITIYLPDYSYSANTNSAGYYQIPHVPIGTYSICASMSGYTEQCLDDIEVLAGQTITVPGFSLVSNFTSLKGQVKFLGETSHGGITVYVGSTSLSTVTDSDGNYSITQIPKNTFDIVFTSPISKDFEKNLTIYDYNFATAANTDDLPVYTLNYGQNLLESRTVKATLTDAVFTDDDNSAFFMVSIAGEDNPRCYYYDKTTKNVTLVKSDVSQIQVSKNSAYLVFVINSTELYSYSIQTGQSVKLADSISTTNSPVITANSARVLYVKNSNQLYSVPIAGGEETQITSATSLQNADSFWPSPDGQYVMVLLGEEMHLYSTDGQSDHLVTYTPKKIAYSNDSNYLVYISQGGHLFSYSLQSYSNALLEYMVYDFIIAKDSQNVVFLMGSDATVHTTYRKAIGGGTSIYLDTVSGDYGLSQDSKSFFYMNADDELYLKDITQTVAPTLIASNVDSIWGPEEFVNLVYKTQDNMLHSLPADTTTPISINTDFTNYKFSPDMDTLIIETSAHSLYSISLTNGTSTFLASDIDDGSFEISQNSSQIVFRATDKVVYRVEINGQNIQAIASFDVNNGAELQTYFPGFSDFNSVFYVNHVKTQTSSYSAETYRINVANFD